MSRALLKFPLELALAPALFSQSSRCCLSFPATNQTPKSAANKCPNATIPLSQVAAAAKPPLLPKETAPPTPAIRAECGNRDATAPGLRAIYAPRWDSCATIGRPRGQCRRRRPRTSRLPAWKAVSRPWRPCSKRHWAPVSLNIIIITRLMPRPRMIILGLSSTSPRQSVSRTSNQRKEDLGARGTRTVSVVPAKPWTAWRQYPFGMKKGRGTLVRCSIRPNTADV